MKTSFTTNCSKEKLAEIRAFLSVLLHNSNISPSVKNEIVLAVDEACANAIIHGNQCDQEKPLQIDIELNPDKLVIEVSDIGITDDETTNQVINYTIIDLIKQRRKGGLGLKLMHSIMDEVNFYTTGNRNICSMTKNLR